MLILVDTREQTPFALPAGIRANRATLATGDYSLAGLETLVAVERKSLPDLVACIGPERERFKRELLRLRSYRCRAVIVEAALAEVMAHKYRSNIKPAAVLGSVASWQTRFDVPFVWAGSHGAEFLLAMFRNFLRQVRELTEAVAVQLPEVTT